MNDSERMTMIFCRDSKLKLDLSPHTSQLYEMYIAANLAIKMKSWKEWYFFNDGIYIDEKFNFHFLYIFNPQFLGPLSGAKKYNATKVKSYNIFKYYRKLKINKTVPFTCSILRVS